MPGNSVQPSVSTSYIYSSEEKHSDKLNDDVPTETGNYFFSRIAPLYKTYWHLLYSHVL